MPGLAGAILRRNSFHAALRTTVAAQERTDHKRGPITITLKLFNSIARDRGPALLAGGVQISSAALQVFFSTHPDLLSSLRRILLDGRSVATEEMTALLRQQKMVRLIISEAAHD